MTRNYRVMCDVLQVAAKAKHPLELDSFDVIEPRDRAVDELRFALGHVCDLVQTELWREYRRRYGEVSEQVVLEAFDRCGLEYTKANVCGQISEYGWNKGRGFTEALAEALSCSDDNNIVCTSIKTVFSELLEDEGVV